MQEKSAVQNNVAIFGAITTQSVNWIVLHTNKNILPKQIFKT